MSNTSMYQYVPVRTRMYLHCLNFALFEIRHHPIISLAWEMYAVAINASVLFLVRTSTYWYVPSLHSCTGMYWYIPVRTILPDPVQVYRIPDEDPQTPK
jgi:hypothetical protein